MSIFQTAPDPNASGQTTLNDLVGEGKKFKTPDDLAKAKLESDRFIEKLQNEQRELREELSKRLSVEEALKRAQEARPQDREPPASPQPQPRQEQSTQPDIAAEVDKVLRQRKQEDSTRSNIDLVTSKLTELYGTVDKAAGVINTRSRDLGMSVEQLQNMASQNPKAFFTLIGVEDKPSQAPGATSWNRAKNPTAMREAAQGQTGQPGTYKYYNELRRSDPSAYFSTRVQLQMDKDAREKGEKFYS